MKPGVLGPQERSSLRPWDRGGRSLVWLTGQFSIPEPVLQAQRRGRLVLFVGAGASMSPPSSLPTFAQLADRVAGEVGAEVTPEATSAPDQFLTRLAERNLPVHERIQRLVEASTQPNAVHSALVRLFPSAGDLRIVTTNYDRHLTTAAASFFGKPPAVYQAPALPLGRDFTGIVHLHGCVDQRPQDLVATFADFGRAYLTDAWAARFLQDMFRTYCVLFVGYSHNDLIMQYLGRGLPPGTERFGLISDEAPPNRDWLAMGITAVTYPSADHHAALTEGLERWAELSGWGLLEQEHQIMDLVAPPQEPDGSARASVPQDPARLSYLESVISQEETVSLFTRHAQDPVWLDWASAQPAFAPLFQRGPALDRVGSALSWWFAHSFAAKFPADAMAVVHQRRGVLHPTTAQDVAASLRTTQPDAQAIGGWVPMLIRSQASGLALSWLLSSLDWPEHRDSILLLLDHLIAPQPQMVPSFTAPGAVRFDVDTLTGDEYSLREVWERLRGSHLDEISHRMLAGMERHLRNAQTACSANRDTSGFDLRSFQRSAIEPHPQDTPPTGFDLVIDIARDCSEHLAKVTPELAVSVFESWAGSDVALLQRLAVHGWNARTDIGADDKLRWLLTHDLLYATATKHEVFRLIANALPGTEDVRSDLLTRILAGPDTDDGEPRRAELRAYEVYNLLTWTCQHDPSFTQAQQALNELQQAHPNFTARKCPDLNITFQAIVTRSPVTTEELSSMVSDEDIDRLLTYQGEPRPDVFAGRQAMLPKVTEAAAATPAWGIRIATALVTRSEWQTDLWPCLLEAWTQTAPRLDEESALDVLGILGRLNQEAVTGEVHAATVRLLRALAADHASSERVLAACEVIGGALVEQAEQEGPAPAAMDLFNDWSYGLTAFWVQEAVRRWNATDEDRRTGLPEASRAALTALVDGRHPRTLTAVATLAQNLPALVAIDENWTTTHLLPAFDWAADTATARAAWTGYLAAPYWNERVLELLRPSLLQCFTHIQDEQLRPTLVTHVADLCLYSATAAQPEHGILTAFLSSSSDTDRKLWAQHIGWRLGKLQPAEAQGNWERWVRDYWARRLDNRPVRLTADEGGQMLDWVLPAGDLFPEAVGLLVKSPSRFPGAFLFFRNLKDSPVLAEHPTETAQLAAHVLTHLDGPVAVCEEIGSVLHALIATGDPELVPTLRQACEGAAKAGCPDALTWAKNCPK
ncbi:SIR2 family protein [Streptomyces sp. IMTB 2501]|uniref:SIR2 family protein n=1 Tax=Streptomyces sp. IMTB 2501 TaxID=1776340 RepID=UPI00117C84A8|nr:SIR2 family protein [Streptomyces sp. IMTB 2501]